MSAIPDFSPEEARVVADTVRERYGREIPTQLADVELRLSPASTQLTPCPAVFWEADNCHFLVCKTGRSRFLGQFYYKGYQQYGTGIREYDDIVDCTVALLRAQADHHLSEAEEQEESAD